MIVKDEEGTLERCLKSVQSVVDEIVIVDTGSADRTKMIAAGFTNRIYDFVWIGDFSAARNASFEKATMDYILWLDADDIVLPNDAIKLRSLKETLDPEIDAVTMRYNTGFDDVGNVVFSYGRERLVKRSRGFRWKEPVHEYLEIAGKTLASDICITHAKQKPRQSGRNILIYEKMLADGKPLSPRGTYYYARELKDHGKFEDAALLFRRFLDSGTGWLEDNISACGELAKCYLALDNSGDALHAMLRSFDYDTPRAELCCQIGYLFKDRRGYRQAAFWFELALNLKRPESARGFYQADCRGYIPCIECSVCYDMLGDYEKAEYYNDLAAAYKPDSPSVLFNRRYFAMRKESDKPLQAGGQEDVTADISGHQS